MTGHDKRTNAAGYVMLGLVVAFVALAVLLAIGVGSLLGLLFAAVVPL